MTTEGTTMNQKPENPPAFPENRFQKVGDVVLGECKSGMTLRDYFAAHCPITLSEFLSGWSGTSKSTIREGLAAYTSFRLQYADDMLKARAA